jgi:hypothetical protein
VPSVLVPPRRDPRLPGDPVRALRHALYRAAKADPGRRFHALYDKISRSDVLWRAWVAVRRNNRAPGIDKITLAQVEEYGIGRLLGELAAELKEGRYRPLPARRVYIPKPGAPAGEQRPLASWYWLTPSGPRNSSRRISPGCTGAMTVSAVTAPPSSSQRSRRLPVRLRTSGSRPATAD